MIQVPIGSIFCALTCSLTRKPFAIISRELPRLILKAHRAVLGQYGFEALVEVFVYPFVVVQAIPKVSFIARIALLQEIWGLLERNAGNSQELL